MKTTIMYHTIAKQIMFGLLPYQRAMIYVIATLCLSSFYDHSKTSNSYFAQQNNLFNIYFVKFSWGWTLISLGVYLLVKSLITSPNSAFVTDQIKISLKMLMRLLIGTAVWYYGTNAFLIVEDQTGVCGVPKYLDKSSCRRNGFFWNGFDISGHCFLLVWCNLVITEEVQASYSKNIPEWHAHKEKNLEVDDNKFSKIDILFCFLSFLTVMWDVMITCTNMFFHTTCEKFLGTAIAVLCWAFLYNFIYKTYLSKWLSL